MAHSNDWLAEAAEEMLAHVENQRARLKAEIASIINKHCPFKRDTVYVELGPRAGIVVLVTCFNCGETESFLPEVFEETSRTTTHWVHDGEGRVFCRPCLERSASVGLHGISAGLTLGSMARP